MALHKDAFEATAHQLHGLREVAVASGAVLFVSASINAGIQRWDVGLAEMLLAFASGLAWLPAPWPRRWALLFSVGACALLWYMMLLPQVPGALLPFFPGLTVALLLLHGWFRGSFWVGGMLLGSLGVELWTLIGGLPQVRTPMQWFGTLVLTLAVWVAVAFRLRRMERRLENLDQQARIDAEWLHRFLPERFIGSDGNVTNQAVEIDAAGLLLVDFVNFTASTRQMPPDSVVGVLSQLYRAFDRIVDHLGMSRIKTVGDEYQALSGMRDTAGGAAQRAILAAWMMREVMNRWAVRRRAHGLVHWQIRIGVHLGPMYAGLIGGDRLQFDVWGNAMNVAHRVMESAGAGEIVVSRDAFESLRGDTPFMFDLKHRSALKGVGIVDLFRLVEAHEQSAEQWLEDHVRDHVRWRREVWPEIVRDATRVMPKAEVSGFRREDV